MTIRTFTIVPLPALEQLSRSKRIPNNPLAFRRELHRQLACLLLLLTGVPMLALPFNQAIAQGPTSAQNLTGETDTDGDGLSDFQERHKYRTDPARKDSSGTGTPDGNGSQRRGRGSRQMRAGAERRGRIGLNAILVCTVTPDHLFPSTACLVQNRLGARGAWGFDLIAACSSFVYGLTVGAHLVMAGTHKKVLVIGADTMSRIIDYTDRATCILFGDGAGAMLLEPVEDGEDCGFIDFLGEIDGSGGGVSEYAGGGSRMPPSHETVDKRLHYVKQDGGQVFKYAVRKMYEVMPRRVAAQRLHGRGCGGDDSAPGEHTDHQRGGRPPGNRAGEGCDQHRPLREYHRRHDSAGDARRHSAGPPQEGRPGLIRRRGRGLYRSARASGAGRIEKRSGICLRLGHSNFKKSPHRCNALKTRMSTALRGN